MRSEAHTSSASAVDKPGFPKAIRRQLGLLIVLLVALVTACGGSDVQPEARLRSTTEPVAIDAVTTTLPGPRPTVAELVPAKGVIGEPTTVAGITLTVDSIVFDTCNDTAPTGKTVAEVRVTITNGSGQTERYGSLDWSLSASGDSYEPEFSDCIPIGDRPPLGPGFTVSRVLSFVVPPSVTGLELLYQPGVSPGGALITIDLGV